jgi:membrane protein DedA with SNARE-associated domain
MIAEFLTSLVNWSTAFIHFYGPYSVFIIVLLEELLVPIPSPLVLMGSGFILIEPGLPFFDAAVKIFFFIALPASIASVLGSLILYGIGYYGGMTVINRLRPFIGTSWDQMKQTEKKLEKKKRVWVTIAFLRAVPLFPIAIVSLFAGVLGLSKKRFALATFVGSLPRTFILAAIGWKFGEAYPAIAHAISLTENLIAAIILVAAIVLLYVYRKRYMQHYEKLVSKVSKIPKKK